MPHLPYTKFYNLCINRRVNNIYKNRSHVSLLTVLNAAIAVPTCRHDPSPGLTYN